MADTILSSAYSSPCVRSMMECSGNFRIVADTAHCTLTHARPHLPPGCHAPTGPGGHLYGPGGGRGCAAAGGVGRLPKSTLQPGGLCLLQLPSSGGARPPASLHPQPHLPRTHKTLSQCEFYITGHPPHLSLSLSLYSLAM